MNSKIDLDFVSPTSVRARLHDLYLNGFESERIIFKPLKHSDTLSWENFYHNNPLLPFLNFKLDEAPFFMAKRWIDCQLDRYVRKRFGHLALLHKHTGTFIGQAGLILRDIEDKAQVEVAYSILPDKWGNGFATEASSRLIQFAFEHKITDRLISIIHVENIASQRVALKNKMRKEKRNQEANRQVYVFTLDYHNWKTCKINKEM